MKSLVHIISFLFIASLSPNFSYAQLTCCCTGCGGVCIARTHETCGISCEINCGSPINAPSFMVACLGTSCNPLPVELIEFRGMKMNQNNIQLNWVTASEINNWGFEIERSNSKDRNWEMIGWKKGQGDSHKTNYYSFEDSTPLEGTNYYRLKQMNIDGNYEYTKTISVKLENENNSIRISHTLVRDKLFLIYDHEENQIQRGIISDMYGNLTIKIHNGLRDLELSHLPPGQYIISIQLTNGKSYVKRFFKINH